MKAPEDYTVGLWTVSRRQRHEEVDVLEAVMVQLPRVPAPHRLVSRRIPATRVPAILRSLGGVAFGWIRFAAVLAPLFVPS